jgi:hypothetical protein
LGSHSTLALGFEVKKKNNLREELGGTEHPLENKFQDCTRITPRAPIKEVLLATKISPPCEEPRRILGVPPARNQFPADPSGRQEPTGIYGDREEHCRILRRWEVHGDRRSSRDR